MKKLLVAASIATMMCGLLAGCNNSKDTVLIYSASEDVINNELAEALKRDLPQYKVVIQYQGTGTLYSKLLAEGKNTDCDIVFDLEGCYAQALVNKQKDIFYNLKDYDFSNFKEDILTYSDGTNYYFAPECRTNVAVVYNKKVLKENNLPIPTTYEELTDSKYKGLISITDPKSSGTGYTYYNTLASVDGLEHTLDFYDRLAPNLKEIATSGSAPLKSTDRGETAIGFAMLWQIVQYMQSNKDLGYTFLDKPSGYALYTFSMVNGKEKNQATKDVFDYMFNAFNKYHVEKYYPDAIYKDQVSHVENYPSDVPTIDSMNGLFDAEYKQNLLDAWRL